MFIVFAVVGLFKFSGGDMRWGFLWYLLTLPLCWLLGMVIERWLSTPCDLWLRRSLMCPAPAPMTIQHTVTSHD